MTDPKIELGEGRKRELENNLMKALERYAGVFGCEMSTKELIRILERQGEREREQFFLARLGVANKVDCDYLAGVLRKGSTDKLSEAIAKADSNGKSVGDVFGAKS